MTTAQRSNWVGNRKKQAVRGLLTYQTGQAIQVLAGNSCFNISKCFSVRSPKLLFLNCCCCKRTSIWHSTLFKVCPVLLLLLLEIVDSVNQRILAAWQPFKYWDNITNFYNVTNFFLWLGTCAFNSCMPSKNSAVEIFPSLYLHDPLY